jgi:hypothetical protein
MARLDQPYEQCEPLKGAGDEDALKFGMIYQVAAAALAAASAVVSGVMAAKQLEIAKQYLAISRGWRDWHVRGYVPLEDAEAAEAMAFLPEKPFYDTAVARARALGKIAVRDAVRRRIRCATAYQTGLRAAALRDAMVAEGEILASMSDAGWRHERDRVRTLDAAGYNRRLQVLNRGREIAASNVNVGLLAGGMFHELSRNGGEGFLEFLGYALEKRKIDPGTEIAVGRRRKLKLTRKVGGARPDEAEASAEG